MDSFCTDGILKHIYERVTSKGSYIGRCQGDNRIQLYNIIREILSTTRGQYPRLQLWLRYGSRPFCVPLFIVSIFSYATCTCGDQENRLWLSHLVTFEYMTDMHEICAISLALLNPSIRQHNVNVRLLFPSNCSEPSRIYHRNRKSETGRTPCISKSRWLFPGSSLKLRPPTWLLSIWTRKQPPRKS